jgi:HAD superfamily hydrolase (TIGR01509 family)
MITIPTHTKGLIFDCDGTLADTMAIHDQAWQETFAHYGLSCSQSFINQHAGVPTERILQLYNQAYGQQVDIASFTEAKENFALQKLTQVKPIPIVVELVNKYQGILPMCVASGGVRTNVLATLEAIGLIHAFDRIITADDPVEPKPSPAIFLLAAKHMNVAPQYCHVLEDGDPGLLAAKKAGMTATDVRPLLKPASLTLTTE